MRVIWEIGARVRFRHQAETGPTFRITATGLQNDLVEIDGLPGQFAQELFVAEGCPADSMASRQDKEAQSGGFDGYAEDG